MIHSNVKRIMEDKGITYLMLENMTKVSSQTVTRAREPRIREINLKKLESIATALGVTIKDLFEEA